MKHLPEKYACEYACDAMQGIMYAYRQGFNKVKGTFSRDLSWVLLYIIKKLFSRASVAHHKSLILLKGHVIIYKQKSSILTAL